jgi:hypothetical protein
MEPTHLTVAVNLKSKTSSLMAAGKSSLPDSRGSVPTVCDSFCDRSEANRRHLEANRNPANQCAISLQCPQRAIDCPVVPVAVGSNPTTNPNEISYVAQALNLH